MVEFFTTTNLGILLLTLGQCLLVLVPLLVALAFLMYADRKVWAAVQMRQKVRTSLVLLACCNPLLTLSNTS